MKRAKYLEYVNFFQLASEFLTRFNFFSVANTHIFIQTHINVYLSTAIACLLTSVFRTARFLTKCATYICIILSFISNSFAFPSQSHESTSICTINEYTVSCVWGDLIQH